MLSLLTAPKYLRKKPAPLQKIRENLGAFVEETQECISWALELRWKLERWGFFCGGRSVGFGSDPPRLWLLWVSFSLGFQTPWVFSGMCTPISNKPWDYFSDFRDILHHLLGAPGLPPATVQVQLASNLCKKILWF